MGDWRCFKCKEKMVEKSIFMTYLEMSLPANGLKCPKCGCSYLTESIVVGKVNPGEKMLEDKPK